MRLIETQSKWGNGYNRAYFANGRKVTESKFDELMHAEMRLHPTTQGKTESTSYGFRTVWESE